jgi:Membrane proteins related to metalloendopeptidases
MRLKVLMIILLVFVLPCFAFSQNEQNVNTMRSRNRQIADSLFEVYQQKRNPKLQVASLPKADTIFRTQQTVKQIVQKYVYDTTTIVKEELQDADEKANITEIKDAPCQTLYNNTWCTNKVKMTSFHFGEFPDELKIRLIDHKHDRCFHFPCDHGSKSSPYGWRWNRPHTGLDIAMNIGEKVYAAFDGVVRVAQVNGGYGRMILIRHYNNLETLYGHLDKIIVKVGQKVKAGDIIGYSGNTGFSTGPHLHFECRCLYQTFDPEWILDMKNRTLKADFINIDKTYFGIERAEKQITRKQKMTSMVKVNKTFAGKPYYSFASRYAPKFNNTMLAKGGNEPVKNMVVINNEDKTTWRYWVVKQGDTIEKIADKFNLTVKQIMEMNGLEDLNLKPNTRIRVR